MYDPAENIVKDQQIDRTIPIDYFSTVVKTDKVPKCGEASCKPNSPNRPDGIVKKELELERGVFNTDFYDLRDTQPSQLDIRIQQPESFVEMTRPYHDLR